MNRLILFFVTIVFAGSALFAQETLKVSVSGKIDSANASTVTIYYYPNLLADQPVSHRAKVEEDGSFTMEFPLSQPVAANLSHGRERTAMFIFPGDDISLTLDPQKFDESIKYKGKTPGVEASNILAEYYLKFEDDQHMESYINLVKEGLGVEFEANSRRELDEKNEFFSRKNKDGKLPEEFINYMSAKILYGWANNRMNYPSYHAYYNKIEESEVEVSKNFYDFLGEVRVKNANAVNNPEYIRFVQSYLDYKMKQNTNGEELSPEEAFIQKFQMASSELEGEALSLIQASMLKDVLSYGNPLAAEGPYFEFMRTNQNEAYNEILTPIYELAMKLAPGQPAPEFSLQDISGADVSLRDFRGQVVYLDFWASWCGPCRREMPAGRELKKRFKGEPVVFLYVSIDDSEEAWRKAVEEEKLEGVLLYSEGFRSEVTQMYGVKAIPNYFLINKDGTIANPSPSRPSGEDIDAQIFEALRKPYDTTNADR